MESATKNRQDVATLKAMIARAYSPDLVPDGADFFAELSFGWFNAAYRIRLRDGRTVVLKIAPPRHAAVMTYEVDIMRTELAALRVISERTSVPVPAVEYVDTSGQIIESDWFFMTFIDADNFGELREAGAISNEESERLHELLGALNRELNDIVGDHFGPLVGDGFPTWRAAFTAMIEGVLTDGERIAVDLGVGYADVRAILARESSVLDDVQTARLVEWDMWPSNVLIRDGDLVAIIDHERAFYGDPLMEAGFAALDLAVWGNPRAFMRGYDYGPLDASARRRRRLYTLYLVLIMIIETKYRKHDDVGPYLWARERMSELMHLYEIDG